MSQVRPPLPPVLPPPPPSIEQMRETIEVQARTIRYLLQNYEQLLLKIERHVPLPLEWSIGTVQTVAVGAAVPKGLWINVGPADCPIDFAAPGSVDITPQQVFFSDGTASPNTTALTTVPLQAQVA